MSKTWTVRRMTSIVLFVLSVAGATILWLMPPAQAVLCENGSTQPVSWEWLLTPAAQQQTDDGLCDPDDVCRQWCMVSCEEVHPQPTFDCFPE